MGTNEIPEKSIDELIAEIREKLIGLRAIPFKSVNGTGEAIEWLLRDLERATRALESKYTYAKDAATALYKRGGTMRARQREYFKDRTCGKLQASKEAEAAFDAVLLEVARHGKPQQATLPLGGEAAHG